MSDIEGTCSDCKWWIPDEGQKDFIGECRGGLPVVFPVQGRIVAGGAAGVAAALIPRMTPPDYWCAKWKQIPGKPPLVQ